MTDPTLLVLASLAEGDKHGYSIMQDVEEFAGVRLGPGTLYGAITRLEERGWIRGVESEDRRKPYTITAQGRRHLAAELDALHNVVKTGAPEVKAGMKRLMGLLVRLYPARWRVRYGEEFEALLEDTGASPRHVWDVLAGALKMQLAHGSLWRICLAGGLAGVAVAAAVSFAIPVRYTSRAILRLSPCDPILGTRCVANPDADRNMAMLFKLALSRDAVARVLRFDEILQRAAPGQSVDQVFALLQKEARIVPVSASGSTRVFAIEFAGPDPITSQHLTQDLVANLIDASTRAASIQT